MDFIRAMLVSTAVVFASGCASVPMAPDEADLVAKRFKVPPGKANVYVYRNETFGSAIRMTVTVNGVLLGVTGPLTFLYTSLVPGQYTLTSRGENESSLTFQAQPDKNYFVWQEIKMGLLSARSSLQPVDEHVGRNGVQECQMARTHPPPSPQTPPASPGCTKDTDCKGERICKAGTCVDPSALTD